MSSSARLFSLAAKITGTACSAAAFVCAIIAENYDIDDNRYGYSKGDVVFITRFLPCFSFVLGLILIGLRIVPWARRHQGRARLWDAIGTQVLLVAAGGLFILMPLFYLNFAQLGRACGNIRCKGMRAATILVLVSTISFFTSGVFNILEMHRASKDIDYDYEEELEERRDERRR